MDSFRQYLNNLFSGYYNYSKPKNWDGSEIRNVIMDSDSIYTRPQKHFSDDIDKNKQMSPYWNVDNTEPLNIIDKDSIYTRPQRFYQESPSLLEMIFNIKN